MKIKESIHAKSACECLKSNNAKGLAYCLEMGKRKWELEKTYSYYAKNGLKECYYIDKHGDCVLSTFLGVPERQPIVGKEIVLDERPIVE